MSTWQVVGVIAIAGGLGGVVAAVLSEDRGFFLPSRVDADGSTILRPGFLGLTGLGAVAAALSFALYGPLATSTIFGTGPASSTGSNEHGITLAALGGAVLVGIAGSKWISSQVDAVTTKAAAAIAAGKEADAAKAAQIAKASPLQALEIAKLM